MTSSITFVSSNSEHQIEVTLHIVVAEQSLPTIITNSTTVDLHVDFT